MDINRYLKNDINSVYIYLNNPKNPEYINVKVDKDDVIKYMNTHYGEGNNIEFTEYTMKDMVYCYNKSNDGQKVYRKILKNHGVKNGIYCYDEELLPPHRFPCTDDIKYKCEIKKFSYRINNRIYLNYEEEKNKDDETYKYIYIHYKHSENVDVKRMNIDILKVMKYLRRMNIQW